MSETDASRFAVAVSEIVTDIILFAFPLNSHASFNIEFPHPLTNVELVIHESGEPFETGEIVAAYVHQDILRTDGTPMMNG